MSTCEGEEIDSIGGRFRAERERLDYTQSALAEELKTTRRTIVKYESDETSPGAETLALFHSLGADVAYIVTGQRAPAVAVMGGGDRATPASRAAAEIAGMRLTEEDAQLLLAMARRLAAK